MNRARVLLIAAVAGLALAGASAAPAAAGTFTSTASPGTALPAWGVTQFTLHLTFAPTGTPDPLDCELHPTTAKHTSSTVKVRLEFYGCMIGTGGFRFNVPAGPSCEWTLFANVYSSLNGSMTTGLTGCAQSFTMPGGCTLTLSFVSYLNGPQIQDRDILNTSNSSHPAARGMRVTFWAPLSYSSNCTTHPSGTAALTGTMFVQSAWAAP